MKIGTLSFERHAYEMALPSSERLKIIESIVRKQDVDILLCAGHTIGTLKDLSKLQDMLINSQKKTTIFFEVHHDITLERNGQPADSYIIGEFSRHSMHVLSPDGQHQNLGGQIFSTSHEVKPVRRGPEKKLLEIFENQLKKRIFEINGVSFFALCCGELNILSGRNNPVFLSEISKKMIMGADVVINATHDLMGNAGTVIAKRKKLSQKANNRKRGCFSVSNWMSIPPENSSRLKQNPNTRTLHMGFISGDEIKPLFVESSAPYYDFRIFKY